MDSCSLEISKMKEVVHFRFAVKGKDFRPEIIDLDCDLSILVRFRRTKKFPGGITEPV